MSVSDIENFGKPINWKHLVYTKYCKHYSIIQIYIIIIFLKTMFVFCVVYPPMFYASAMFIYKCHSYYDYTQLLCKWPCYFYNEQWTNVDLFFNTYTPLFSIPVFCSIIYIRALFRKHILKQQRFKWRRDKKISIVNLDLVKFIFNYVDAITIVYPYIVLLSFHNEMLKSRRTAPLQPMGN